METAIYLNRMKINLNQRSALDYPNLLDVIFYLAGWGYPRNRQDSQELSLDQQRP